MSRTIGILLFLKRLIGFDETESMPTDWTIDARTPVLLRPGHAHGRWSMPVCVTDLQ